MLNIFRTGAAAVLLFTLAACKKESAPVNSELVKGSWVLSSFSVSQQGGESADWYSIYNGDARDYIDLHPDGVLEYGDAWNGMAPGNYELRGDGELLLYIKRDNGIDTISRRITEVAESSLSLTDHFNVGAVAVEQRYHYWRR